MQLSALDRAATVHMRLFFSGSAPLLPETPHQFLQRTGHAILERYGMTETLINTSNPYEGPRKPGSVGVPLPGIEVRLVGEAAAVGALEVSGPNVMAGYWRDPEKTWAEFTADGWFKTGDLGRIDHDGFVHIVGRAKDLVISGGYNVYPKEVELELDALSGERGVRCSAPGFWRGRCRGGRSPILGSVDGERNTLGKVQKNVLRAAYGSLFESLRRAVYSGDCSVTMVRVRAPSAAPESVWSMTT